MPDRTRRQGSKGDARCSNTTFAVQNPTFGVQNAKILNGRLPHEDGSNRCETLPTRVSDDSRHLIFRRPAKTFMNFSEQQVSMKSKIIRFGGAMNFKVLLGDSPRKITPFPSNFKSLRSLVKALQNDFRFFR